jgi:hypothetical protein
MDLGQNEESAVIDYQAQTAVALGPGPTDPLVPVFQMLGRGIEEQQRQPASLIIHGGVKHPFANGFDAAQVMVFLEQFLKVALQVRLGHGHDFDFIKTRRSGTGDWRDGQFFAFHAAEDKKLAEDCSAKSALTPSSLPLPTLMHTCWQAANKQDIFRDGGNHAPGNLMSWRRPIAARDFSRGWRTVLLLHGVKTP